LSEDTINFASDMNDQMAVLKLQGQSALASLVAGAPDAEEKLQNFFDSVMELLDSYIPAFANFAIRLFLQATVAIIRIAPTLVVEIVSTLIDVVFSINWFQFGIDLGKAILEGLVNIVISTLNSILKIFGVKIPKISFGDTGKSNYFENVDTGGSYEMNNKVTQDININIEASGDTAVSEETAKKTAEKLAPYIDKILGGV